MALLGFKHYAEDPEVRRRVTEEDGREEVESWHERARIAGLARDADTSRLLCQTLILLLYVLYRHHIVYQLHVVRVSRHTLDQQKHVLSHLLFLRWHLRDLQRLLARQITPFCRRFYGHERWSSSSPLHSYPLPTLLTSTTADLASESLLLDPKPHLYPSLPI